MDFEKSKNHRQGHKMDLKSKINSWWAKGATKRKIIEPTTEKDLERQIPNSLHGENQPTICLICDQNFKGVKQCLEHIQILHGLQNLFENYHYQIRDHSEEDSTFPVQEVKVDVQRKRDIRDGTFKPKPKVVTSHIEAKRPRKFIPSRDPLGLMKGQFPTQYLERVTRLIREDDPTSQMEAEVKQNTTFEAAPQNVIQQPKKVVIIGSRIN